MPDLPRDPRQLARDILAGKISIEELAREQQRRAAGGGAMQPRPAQAKMPERIPLPRQIPQQPKPPIIRRPSPPPPRPTPRPVVKTQPARRSIPAPLPPLEPLVVPPPPTAPTPVAVETSVAKAPRTQENIALKKIARNRAALRQSIIMAEVLAKPLALREDW